MKEPENVWPVQSTGKQADGEKSGETYYRCKAQENKRTVKRAGNV